MRCTYAQRNHRTPGCIARRSPDGTHELLPPGERIVTDAFELHGWRYEATDVAYEHRTLTIGGPFLFVLTGTLSALRNRSARRAAEAQAAAQWRPLGPLTVLATTERLLVWHHDAWCSVWYSAVDDLTCDGSQLSLTFSGAAPYLLAGEVSELAAVIESACSRSRV